VLPQYRGSGLGSELIDRLEQHLRATGVEDLILGALPGNTDAIRLYERRGYQPTWLHLCRLTGAVEPLPGGCEPRSSATMGKAIRIKSEGTSPHE
jgi:RimJ/RimL family protein N-acetyltransferase